MAKSLPPATIAALNNLQRFVDLVPAVRNAPDRSLWLSYDQEADVLYINFKKPACATDSELTDDDVIVRYEGKQVVGLTVLHASQRHGVSSMQGKELKKMSRVRLLTFAQADRDMVNYGFNNWNRHSDEVPLSPRITFIFHKKNDGAGPQIDCIGYAVAYCKLFSTNPSWIFQNLSHFNNWFQQAKTRGTPEEKEYKSAFR